MINTRNYSFFLRKIQRFILKFLNLRKGVEFHGVGFCCPWTAPKRPIYIRRFVGARGSAGDSIHSLCVLSPAQRSLQLRPLSQPKRKPWRPRRPPRSTVSSPRPGRTPPRASPSTPAALPRSPSPAPSPSADVSLPHPRTPPATRGKNKNRPRQRAEPRSPQRRKHLRVKKPQMKWRRSLRR